MHLDHVLSRGRMKGAFQGTLLPFMQTCHLLVWQLLADHFCQSLSVLKCHIRWVTIFCMHNTFSETSLFWSNLIYLQLLEHITFVDTPGVLSGEKQRTQRSYDFTGVISWFAAKCDLILLLFDPHKLDISDEFKRVISSLRGHDDKIRVVLNKADQVDTQQVK